MLLLLLLRPFVDEAIHLLTWAISQLCRQIGTVPAEVVEIFRAGTDPAVAELLSALSAVVQSFNTAFFLNQRSRRDTKSATASVYANVPQGAKVPECPGARDE